MATYVNDLRLKEITPGDEDGTWGTSTNTNLSLIADGFSYATKQMAADANETFTMPDGTADATRSIYLKITSAVSLTATRTVTLGPNTVSKTWIIENATSGSQSINIKQGSGAEITIATGKTSIVATDGAGAGAAVVSPLGTIQITGGVITGITDLAVADGGTGASTAAAARVNLLNSYATNAGKVLAVNAGATDTEWLAVAGVGTVTSVALSGGTTGLTVSGSPITAAGTITLAGTLAVGNGGTNITSYTAGDMLYASNTTVLSALAKGTTYQSLNMNAGATAPEWQASLQSLMTAQGDMVYSTGANTPARLAKGTALQQLRMNSGATAPEWATISSGIVTVVTATTATTLDSTQTLLEFTPTGYGAVVTIDTASMTDKAPYHCIANRSAYPVPVESGSVLKGFVPPKTDCFVDYSTSAGLSFSALDRAGITNFLSTTTFSGLISSIALDSDRDFVLGYNSSSHLYGVVVNHSTNSIGSPTLIRTATIGDNACMIKSATDAVLVLSCPSGSNAFQAVVCSISGTTITPDTAAADALSAGLSSFSASGVIQVGTSFIVGYTVATPAAQIREITISGTTPTISAATVLDGTAGALIVAGSATVVIAVSTATTHLYTKPYSIGGLAAGTGTDTNNGTMTLNKLAVMGSYWGVIYNDGGSTIMGGVITLASTTTTISTATLCSTGTVTDAILFSSTRMFVTGSGGPANTLINTAGTASAGTELNVGFTGARCLFVTGNYVAVFDSDCAPGLLVDCSGASPTSAFTIPGVTISVGTIGTINATNAMLVKNPASLVGTDYFALCTPGTLNLSFRMTGSAVSFDPNPVGGGIINAFGTGAARVSDSVLYGYNSNNTAIARLACA